MDNNYSVNFYEAYVLWKATLKDDKTYEDYKKSLNGVASGDNSLSGVVSNKILDLAWIEKVETTLPYMDKAIRESRSYIEQKDEIVSIEKVKRVNTQSIRHLAQHTNLIARVEDNGDVLPERILNIFYDSNMAIYENRFLYTLLGKLVDFVEKAYKALKDKDEKIDINYQINKAIRRKNKTSKMVLDFEYKSSISEKFDLNDDTSKLPGYARVLRIRSIIHDFYSSPLIKAMAGVETVKPPIVHTNLMSKNVNFRNCLELWEYIDRYKGIGFAYEGKAFTGKMPNKINDDLLDIFIFSNFLSEITFNEAYKRSIKYNYEERIRLENQRIKESLKAEQDKQIAETLEIVKEALEKKAHKYDKMLAFYIRQNEKLEYRNELLEEKHKNLAKKNKNNKVVKEAIKEKIVQKAIELKKAKQKLKDEKKTLALEIIKEKAAKKASIKEAAKKAKAKEAEKKAKAKKATQKVTDKAKNKKIIKAEVFEKVEKATKIIKKNKVKKVPIKKEVNASIKNKKVEKVAKLEAPKVGLEPQRVSKDADTQAAKKIPNKNRPIKKAKTEIEQALNIIKNIEVNNEQIEKEVKAESDNKEVKKVALATEPKDSPKSEIVIQDAISEPAKETINANSEKTPINPIKPKVAKAPIDSNKPKVAKKTADINKPKVAKNAATIKSSKSTENGISKPVKQ